MIDTIRPASEPTCPAEPRVNRGRAALLIYCVTLITVVLSHLCERGLALRYDDGGQGFHQLPPRGLDRHGRSAARSTWPEFWPEKSLHGCRSYSSWGRLRNSSQQSGCRVRCLLSHYRS